jgi:hypothetical protein
MRSAQGWGAVIVTAYAAIDFAAVSNTVPAVELRGATHRHRMDNEAKEGVAS